MVINRDSAYEPTIVGLTAIGSPMAGAVDVASPACGNLATSTGRGNGHVVESQDGCDEARAEHILCLMRCKEIIPRKILLGQYVRRIVLSDFLGYGLRGLLLGVVVVKMRHKKDYEGHFVPSTI